MGFCINFCTNVMSGHVMSGLTLLCTDLRFGLSPASPPLQSPFCHSFSLLLDFLVPLLPQGPILRYFSLFLDFLLPPLLLKVQSATLARSFWTSSHLPSTSKSILSLARSFWTSAHLPATSKSIPPLLLAPFGLPRIFPLPQSPFRSSFSLHHAKKADCKAIRQSQSTSLNQPVQSSISQFHQVKHLQ